ncbi:hypothetical protein IHV25_03075 [Phaeovibrio sulfidiphilus]|uniref:Uncharacterized protein n=1 Tax=Phaeovibrio sulfidiphilus TaxID=1220600 RepID=A0A8J7CD36_9PROT|nr:hypothetical protein [Phaeovibrio sulfidiphilus]MBE1236634.1 hypothetical protein [Phaeovibrio sulfidiphilus]
MPLSSGIESKYPWLVWLRAVPGGLLLALWLVGYTFIFDPSTSDSQLTFYYWVTSLVMIPALLALGFLAYAAFIPTWSRDEERPFWRVVTVWMLVWALGAFPAWWLATTLFDIGPLFSHPSSSPFFALFIYPAVVYSLWPVKAAYLRIAGRTVLAVLAGYALFWGAVSAYCATSVQRSALEIAPEAESQLFIARTLPSDPVLYHPVDASWPWYVYQHKRARWPDPEHGNPYSVVLETGGERYFWSFWKNRFEPFPAEPAPEAEPQTDDMDSTAAQPTTDPADPVSTDSEATEPAPAPAPTPEAR